MPRFFGTSFSRPSLGSTRSAFLVVAAACVSACVPRAPSPQASCDRQCLKLYADRYLEALAAREPSRLPVARSVRFTENGREQRLGDGLWRSAGAFGTYREYIVDQESGAVAVQTILMDGSSRVQLLLRLRIKHQRISEIETLVARRGDTCCWDADMLGTLSSIFGQNVSPTERRSRRQLIALAEAYFEALHTAGTPLYRRTVVAQNMNRYENGKQTTNVVGGNRIIRRDAQTQLDSAMFGRIGVVNRRYPVVDVGNGTLLGIVVFEYPTSTRPSEIIAEFFKFDGSTIREIRAVMVKQSSTGWH
jgi:hypothetical protein